MIYSFSYPSKPCQRFSQLPSALVASDTYHIYMVAALESFERPAPSASAIASRMLSTYPSTFLAGCLALRWCHFPASCDLWAISLPPIHEGRSHVLLATLSLALFRYPLVYGRVVSLVGLRPDSLLLHPSAVVVLRYTPLMVFVEERGVEPLCARF